MAGVAFAGANSLGFPVVTPDGRTAYALGFVAVDLQGNPVGIGNVATGGGSDLDTNGNPVPTYKAQSFTYDDGGNLKTASVTDGTSIWVRTYSFANGYPSGDSGWVKQ